MLSFTELWSLQQSLLIQFLNWKGENTALKCGLGSFFGLLNLKTKLSFQVTDDKAWGRDW